jgi:hypothetical protein
MSCMCKLILCCTVLCSPVWSAITRSGTVDPDGLTSLDCLLDPLDVDRSLSVEHLADWSRLPFFAEPKGEPTAGAKPPPGSWELMADKTACAKRSPCDEESGTVDNLRRRAIHLDGSGKSSSLIKLRFSCSWTIKTTTALVFQVACETVQ